MGLILITDDAAFARRMVRKAVLKGEHEVLEAKDAQECLEIAANNSPDCIILDLLMPELDGFGVLKALQDKGTNIPVIVLSADIQDSVKEECEKLGAFRILRKPPKEKEIVDAIAQALSSS